MRLYKGFDKDLKCRGFQFEVGRSYEESNARLCRKGFHACENPFDVFSYYPPSDSRYCLVEMDGVTEETEGDSKRCGRKIHIGAEIGLKGIIEAGVKFIFDKIDWENLKKSNTGVQRAATNEGGRSSATNTGDQSVATNTGHWSVATNEGSRSSATNTGDQSVATNTGYQSAATNTGDQSVATNTGDWSLATNIGDQSIATNTGDQSVAANTGHWSAATNTGHLSTAINTGSRSSAIVEGKDSISVVTGYKSKAKGSIGCWLVLTERNNWMEILDIQSVKVDGKGIKEDTFYTLTNSVVTEVTEQ